MSRNAGEISDEAARWVLRREDPDWSADEQVELEAWMAESTLHRAAFLRLERLRTPGIKGATDRPVAPD